MRRFEIAMLDDGGFIVGPYPELGCSGQPRFACTQLGDALAYLERQIERADRLKHTDAGSQLNRGPNVGNRVTPEQMGRCTVEPADFVTKTRPPSQRVQPPPAPPATKAPTRLSDGLPIGSPPPAKDD